MHGYVQVGMWIVFHMYMYMKKFCLGIRSGGNGYYHIREHATDNIARKRLYIENI